MSRDKVDPELVSVINRRFDVLSALEGGRDKRDLVDELDISRSTINRAVRQLESLGLVTRGNGYRQTVGGRLVADVYDGFVGELADVMALEELLQSLPPGAPMSTAMVRDADVERSSGPTPTRPLDGVVDVMSTTDRFRALVPRISRPDLLTTFDEELVQAGVPTDAVFSEGLSDYVRTEHPEVFELLTRMNMPLQHVQWGMNEGEKSSYPEAARKYVAKHSDRVEYWVTGSLPGS